jgi:hypothetical protein
MLSTDTLMAERRQYPRIQLRMPLHVTRLDPDGGDVVEQVEMVDISRGGLGAMARRWHYPGQRVMLRLPAPGMSVRSICGIVRRCCSAGGMVRLGIEFERPLTSLCAEEHIDSAVAA